MKIYDNYENEYDDDDDEYDNAVEYEDDDDKYDDDDAVRDLNELALRPANHPDQIE